MKKKLADVNILDLDEIEMIICKIGCLKLIIIVCTLTLCKNRIKNS